MNSFEINAVRRILNGVSSFLIDNWEVRGPKLVVTGWALVPATLLDGVCFVANGVAPRTERLWLKSDSLAKVFPFHEGAERSGFILEFDVRPEDTALGYIELALVDKLLGEPLNRWHTTYIPLEATATELPTAAQLQRTQGNTSAPRYLAYGLSTAVKINSLLEIYFRRSLAQFGAVLDWGCGCGRVTRQLGAAARVVGVDIDTENVAWCKRHLKGEFYDIGLFPPTQFADNSFDLILGISVFTHLTEQAATAWRDEICRLLQPGGVAVISVHAAAALARVLDDQKLLNAVDAGFEDSTRDTRLDAQLSDQSYYRATLQSEAHVRRFFSESFLVVDQIHGANALLQDFVLLQKNTTTVALRGKETVGSDDTRLRTLAKFTGDPWQPQNKYFADAEKGFLGLWESRIFPFIKGSDFTTTVDLAAGMGRNAEKLAEYASELYVIDINSGLVDACRQRFSQQPRFRFAVGNGYDLRPVEDGWASFVYCFDAMVHFDSDVVRSYLKDLRRALKPGGKGFFHHSNQTNCSADWTRNLKARNFMSLDLFRHYCEKEGLVVVKQQAMDWAEVKGIDGFSLVMRPE